MPLFRVAIKRFSFSVEISPSKPSPSHLVFKSVA